MQSDLNVCEPTFSPRSRVLKGRDDAVMAGESGILSGLSISVLLSFSRRFTTNGAVAAKGVLHI